MTQRELITLEKEIARLVQNKWDKNFVNEIKIVIGMNGLQVIYHIICHQDPYGLKNLKILLII